MSILILALIITIIEIILAIRKKQGKEAAVILLLGTITLAYGYYYDTHIHTASLVKIMFAIFNIQ